MSGTPRDSLPAIAPAALAVIVERAAPRILKKLDAAPDVAGTWRFEQHSNAISVTTDTGECVRVDRIDPSVRTPDQLTCSCLLAPKCFHILAVATYLPVEAEEAAATPIAPPTAITALATESPALSEERREVARRALDVLAVVLESGLTAMGAQARAELLRSVHAARVHGLHRLASRTLSVAESGRALRERSPSFELEQAVRALGEAAVTAHQLARGVASREVVGVARRTYEDVGAKRVMGVACEPVLTRSGYAGVVTYVVDEALELFTVQDVAPGDAGRALASYRATVRLGEASLAHGELARRGLFVQGATASQDHRLGAGARVSAVSAAGARFDEAPFSALFALPFATQLERALEAAAAPDASGPALMFIRGTLAGVASSGALFLLDGGGADGRLVTLAMPSQHDAFACNENMRLLRTASGTRLHVVGKVARRRPGVIELLAIGDVDGSLSLSPESMGRVQVAFDALARGQLRGEPEPIDAGIAAMALQPDGGTVDPVAAIERRVERMVLGGRRSLTTSASREVALEAGALGAALLPTTRRALEGLLVASATTSARTSEAPRRLLEAWLRAYAVTASVRRTLASAAWVAR